MAMPKNKKRTNEADGGSGSSSPPLKRQKIVAAAIFTDEMASRFLQLEQRLQSAEDANARLEQRLQQQERKSKRTIDDFNLPEMKMPD